MSDNTAQAVLSEIKKKSDFKKTHHKSQSLEDLFKQPLILIFNSGIFLQAYFFTNSCQSSSAETSICFKAMNIKAQDVTEDVC